MGSLYWNRTGRIACMRHAPAADRERWKLEGWREMTDDERSMIRCDLFEPGCEDCRQETKGESR